MTHACFRGPASPPFPSNTSHGKRSADAPALEAGPPAPVRLALGRMIDAQRPTFEATAGGKIILVELDSSAVFRLVNHGSGKAARHALEEQRGAIQQAAQQLFDRGMLGDGDGHPTICLSALDFGKA